MNRKNTNLLFAGFSVAFAVLMSVPFIVPHTGFLALAGFLPLLMMDRIATMNGTRHFWAWHYLSFVLWNAFTTFWVCNATVGGGIFAVLANSFQMSVIFGLFRFSRKRFTGALPYVFLAAAWIAWERAYFDVDISWPWLVLGNAFAGSVKSVQWYEYNRFARRLAVDMGVQPFHIRASHGSFRRQVVICIQHQGKGGFRVRMHCTPCRPVRAFTCHLRQI